MLTFHWLPTLECDKVARLVAADDGGIKEGSEVVHGHSTMSALVEDIIKANFVLVGFRLLNTQESVENFRNNMGTDVQIANMAIDPNVEGDRLPPALALVLQKDRIALQLSSVSSIVEMDYPTLDTLPRLSAVIARALEYSQTTEQAPRAFGYNMELVCQQDSGDVASAYISKRVFTEARIHPKWELIGGHGQMRFADEDGRRWQVALAPRFEDESTTRVYLRLNLHIAEQRLPDAEEVLDSMNTCWNHAREFLDYVDARG